MVKPRLMIIGLHLENCFPLKVFHSDELMPQLNSLTEKALHD